MRFHHNFFYYFIFLNSKLNECFRLRKKISEILSAVFFTFFCNSYLLTLFYFFCIFASHIPHIFHTTCCYFLSYFIQNIFYFYFIFLNFCIINLCNFFKQKFDYENRFYQFRLVFRLVF